jgi:hypothetical protein
MRNEKWDPQRGLENCEFSGSCWGAEAPPVELALKLGLGDNMLLDSFHDQGAVANFCAELSAIRKLKPYSNKQGVITSIEECPSNVPLHSCQSVRELYILRPYCQGADRMQQPERSDETRRVFHKACSLPQRPNPQGRAQSTDVQFDVPKLHSVNCLLHLTPQSARVVHRKFATKAHSKEKQLSFKRIVSTLKVNKCKR